jgi:hypothetical protein
MISLPYKDVDNMMFIEVKDKNNPHGKEVAEC